MVFSDTKRRWSLQLGTGVLSYYWIRWARKRDAERKRGRGWCHLTEEVILSSCHTSHPPEFIKPPCFCFCVKSPSVSVTLNFSPHFCFTSLIWLLDGLNVVLWNHAGGCRKALSCSCQSNVTSITSAVVSRSMFVKKRDSKHSCSAGCTAKPPCGWYHRSNHNKHICVHANKVISRG